MTGAKEATTPLSSSATYSLVDGSSQVDATSYSHIVGSLLCLTIAHLDVSLLSIYYLS